MTRKEELLQQLDNEVLYQLDEPHEAAVRSFARTVFSKGYDFGYSDGFEAGMRAAATALSSVQELLK